LTMTALESGGRLVVDDHDAPFGLVLVLCHFVRLAADFQNTVLSVTPSS
jgi:hypothetical protein